MATIKAWHFVGDTLRDGSPIPDDGVVLKHVGPIKMCRSGFHASVEPFDALQYAPRSTLCLVECGGEIIHDKDKLVCSERMIIARMDATEMLRYFARMQALSVIEDYPNDTDQVVFDYLMTGEEGLRSAAYSAARAAAWAAKSAAYSAASAAAESAAGPAARAAAWSAKSAARAAAESAAESMAWPVAWSSARGKFNALVRECFEAFLTK